MGCCWWIINHSSADHVHASSRVDTYMLQICSNLCINLHYNDTRSYSSFMIIIICDQLMIMEPDTPSDLRAFWNPYKQRICNSWTNRRRFHVVHQVWTLWMLETCGCEDCYIQCEPCGSLLDPPVIRPKTEEVHRFMWQMEFMRNTETYCYHKQYLILLVPEYKM